MAEIYRPSREIHIHIQGPDKGTIRKIDYLRQRWGDRAGWPGAMAHPRGWCWAGPSQYKMDVLWEGRGHQARQLGHLFHLHNLLQKAQPGDPVCPRQTKECPLRASSGAAGGLRRELLCRHGLLLCLSLAVTFGSH